MKKIIYYLSALVLILGISACNLSKYSDKSNDPVQVQTFAMQTVQVMATEKAFATLASNATEISNLPTAILMATLTPTQIPQQNTDTPQSPSPSNTVPPPTAVVLMDKATFITDVTIPDKTTLAGGTTFIKTWRLRNDGQNTWTADYELVFSSGNSMEGKPASKIGVNVKPGETVDLSIELKSPLSSGDYKGEWMLRTANGKLFGVGEKADKPFWVEIRVDTYKSESVPPEIYPLDFVAKICNAQWKTSHSSIRMPCDTDKTMSKAYVAVLSNPKLENGYQDDERTIHFHLEGDNGSWIQGFYPAFLINDGATFSTVVGCLEGSRSCNATISLDVKIDGGNPINLGKWVETYDEKLTKIEINLQDYKGKNLEFILGISNRSNTTSDIFWLAPRVVQ